MLIILDTHNSTCAPPAPPLRFYVSLIKIFCSTKIVKLIYEEVNSVNWSNGIILWFFFLILLMLDLVSATCFSRCISSRLINFKSALIFIINCSRTKFIAIIVNVGVFFMQNFYLTILTFRVTFTPFLRFVTPFSDFLRFAWSKILSQSEFQAAELNWWQFNTKNQMKSAPKLVSFLNLNLNSGIY